MLTNLAFLSPPPFFFLSPLLFMSLCGFYFSLYVYDKQDAIFIYLGIGHW